MLGAVGQETVPFITISGPIPCDTCVCVCVCVCVCDSPQIQVMRLIYGSVPELQRASHLPSPYSQPLGPSSEQRVLKKTLDYLRGILSSYPSSLEVRVQYLTVKNYSGTSLV